MVKVLRFRPNRDLQELLPALHFLGRKEEVSDLFSPNRLKKQANNSSYPFFCDVMNRPKPLFAGRLIYVFESA